MISVRDNSLIPSSREPCLPLLGEIVRGKLMRPEIDQFVTFVYTEDLENSAEFYENTLNLPLVLDQGACRIYRVSNDGFLGICSAGDTQSEPRGVILTLVTDAVDEWYDYLVGKGVAIEKPPQLNPKFNIYHLFVRDPNGYLIEIQTFRSPDWPHKSS
jgi:catechol 2,3-dioxygenase-like lactoylglutathione lyase family enzyme